MSQRDIAMYEVPYERLDARWEEAPDPHDPFRASPEHREKMRGFESLDFNIADNQIWREWTSAMPKKAWMEKTIGKWLMCLVIGIVVGIVAYVIRWCAEGLNELKYHTSEHYVRESGLLGFVTYYAMNVAFSTGAFICVLLFGGGVASSGIPEITAYLNGIRVPKAFNIKTFVGKIFSVIFVYASSLALGPEGPMIHLGSLVGSALGPFKSKTLGIYTKMGWKYGNDREKRDFISSGAAAGISAAFGAPIGGTLFALEEATSFWSRQLGWRTLFCCMTATFTVNAILQIKAQTQEVQDYGLLTFGFSNTYLYRYIELIPFCLMALIGGVVGAGFVHANTRINKWRGTFFAKKHWIYKYIEVLAIVTLASVLCFGISAAYPCRSRSELVLFNTTGTCDSQTNDLTLVTMFCDEETEYNDMASLLWTPPNVALPLLYHRDRGTFSLLTLGIYTLVYFGLATISSGLTVAGGLFIPMMLVGAGLGRFVGTSMLHMFPTASPPIDPSIYALLGSAAVMTGFCRMTISLVVILLELTEGTQYLLPIILVVMIAKWVGDYLSHSIYDCLIEMKGMPFLENNPPKVLSARSVTEFMEKNVITFTEIEKVDNIAKALHETNHHGFPVIANDTKVFRGLILRSQLMILLEKKLYASDPSSQSMKQLAYPEFADLLTRKLPATSEKLYVDGDADLEKFVDLRPYINRSSITAHTSFSFLSVYGLFRTMGLRHVVVLNDEHRVAGIVTRKDLL